MPVDGIKVKFALSVFIVAAAVRICYLVSIPQPSIQDDVKEYDRLGVALAEGRGYVAESGAPTANRPPVYPLFLAAIYHAAGHDVRQVGWAQAIISAGICVLIYFIAIKLFDNVTAKLSAALSSLYPPFVVDLSQILSETLFTFFLLLGILLVISKSRWQYQLSSGVVFGLAILTRSFLVFFTPFLFYWLALKDNSTKLKAMAIVFGGMTIVLAPWTVRNFYALNAFVPLANIGGATFYNSYVVPPISVHFFLAALFFTGRLDFGFQLNPW